jgi:hypothetical protein
LICTFIYVLWNVAIQNRYIFHFHWLSLSKWKQRQKKWVIQKHPQYFLHIAIKSWFLFDTVRIWEFSPVWTDSDKCHKLSKRNVKLILKILSDLEPLRGSSNKKTYVFNSFVCKLGFLLAWVGQFKTTNLFFCISFLLRYYLNQNNFVQLCQLNTRRSSSSRLIHSWKNIRFNKDLIRDP